jgi:hypothetical protein
MASSPVSPRLALIQLHPIKCLDPVLVKKARIGSGASRPHPPEVKDVY